jgi:predicted nucleotidyltransferase
MNSDSIELLKAFDQENIKYLIVGGYAVGFHAEPRYTKEIDIFISTDPENARAIYRTLVAFGAPLDEIEPEDFQNQELFYQIGVPPNRVDILMGIPGVAFEKAWTNRVQTDVDGVPLKYIALDDLIAAKKASGRDQDLMDIKSLEHVRDMKNSLNQAPPESPAHPTG